MLTSFLRAWVSAGLSHYPHENVTPVRLTNVIAFLVSLISIMQLPAAIVFWPEEGQWQFAISVSVIVALVCVPLLNRRTHYLSAKLMLVSVYLIDLVLTTWVWQLDLHIHFFYLLAIVCVPFLFVPSETWCKWLFTLVFAGLFVLSEGYYQLYLPNNYSVAQQSFKLSSAALLVLATLLCSFHIQKNVTKSWQKVAFERKRSEQLLLNILPNSIAQRLKSSKGLIADYFAQASILFADIQDFTPLCKKHSPQQLVRILNEVFCEFDELSVKYGLEKIKTSGDGYMAAGGLPKANSQHAASCCYCALDMLDAFNRISLKYNLKTGLRIGIGCGEVVAGIIGKNKFSYDMWGEAVNLASRMESQGAENRVQTTQSTYELTKALFDYEARGQVNVKGIGPVTTYWLKGPKSP
jgi:guanylate cyclase